MDVSDLAVHTDMVSLSGHKIYGPQGIGVLYIRRDLQDRIEPLIYGGGQQAGLRSGTVPMPVRSKYSADPQVSIVQQVVTVTANRSQPWLSPNVFPLCV